MPVLTLLSTLAINLTFRGRFRAKKRKIGTYLFVMGSMIVPAEQMDYVNAFQFYSMCKYSVWGGSQKYDDEKKI